MVKRFKAQWEVRYQRSLADFKDILSRDPFSDWEAVLFPGELAERHLDYGLTLLYARPKCRIGMAFIRNAHKISERAIADGQFELGRRISRFPENRGRTYRALAHSSAILFNRLNESALMKASQDYQTWAEDLKPSQWNAIGQAHGLAAFRLALLAGNRERASAVAGLGRSFRFHENEYGLWKALLGSPWPVSRALETRVRTFFDRVRNPMFDAQVFVEVPILRFETGALLSRVSSSGSEIDWRGTIAEIAR